MAAPARRPTQRQYFIRRVVFLGVSVLALTALFSGVRLGLAALTTTEPETTSSPTPTQSQSSKPADLKACDDSAIQVAISAEAGPDFTLGDEPVLTADITNVSTAACLRDVGSAANEIYVTNADGYRVWSSNRCPTEQYVKLVEMQPQALYRVTITWPGTRNPKTCGEVAEPVKPGEFSVYAKNGGSESEPAILTMSQN